MFTYLFYIYLCSVFISCVLQSFHRLSSENYEGGGCLCGSFIGTHLVKTGSLSVLGRVSEDVWTVDTFMWVYSSFSPLCESVLGWDSCHGM